MNVDVTSWEKNKSRHSFLTSSSLICSLSLPFSSSVIWLRRKTTSLNSSSYTHTRSGLSMLCIQHAQLTESIIILYLRELAEVTRSHAELHAALCIAKWRDESRSDRRSDRAWRTEREREREYFGRGIVWSGLATESGGRDRLTWSKRVRTRV